MKYCIIGYKDQTSLIFVSENITYFTTNDSLNTTPSKMKQSE